MESIHKTVLLNETIEGLNLTAKSIVVDCTFGGGGHSAEICKKYPGVEIIALDQDADVFERTNNKFKNSKCKIIFANVNFRNLDEALREEKIEKVNAVIFDLGLSSDQLENSGRGFSFVKDEPLLMNFKKNTKEDPSPEDITAQEVVNTWEEKSLADIIYGYGEEKFAKRIARGIVDARAKSKIETTQDLVRVISDSVPAFYRRGRIHFATRTFQALRITVNDELGALKEGLEKGFNVLNAEGRMSVISFHSLEDRIVKRFFSAKGGSASGGKENRVANILTKKPIIASQEELKNNPRARSAKLRILEKIQ